MNVFNRIVMVLLLIGAIIAIPIFMVVPGPILKYLAEQLNLLQSSLYPNRPLLNITHQFLVMVGILAIIPCGILLWLELRRPGERTVVIQQVKGSEARLTLQAIGQRLRYHLDALSDVTEVKPIVVSKGKGVEVRLVVETSPEVNVPAKTEEVGRVARQVVEEQMGLRLERLHIELRHAPYPKGAKPVSPPAPGAGELPPAGTPPQP